MNDPKATTKTMEMEVGGFRARFEVTAETEDDLGLLHAVWDRLYSVVAQQARREPHYYRETEVTFRQASSGRSQSRPTAIDRHNPEYADACMNEDGEAIA